MNKVKRFNSEFRGMIERPDGQFVFASEYDKVQDQLCASQADAVELARKYYNRTPTEWAYGQVCSALEKHRARADEAESNIDYFGSLVSKARVSADKAMVKFPQPNYVLLKVAEEAGEVVQAGVHYAEGRMKWEQLEGEVVQLLAMLIRLVTEGDQVNGVTPPESCRDFKPAPAAYLAAPPVKLPQLELAATLTIKDGEYEWDRICYIPDGEHDLYIMKEDGE